MKNDQRPTIFGDGTQSRDFTYVSNVVDGNILAVTKDVPNYALVVGNPAKIIGWVSVAGEKLNFNGNNITVCSRTGMKFEKVADDLVVEVKD